MSNAGYGNHDAPKPGSAATERPSPEAASAKPGAGSQDRAGFDLGGASDLSAVEGAMAGSRSNPDTTGAGPHSGMKDSSSPTLSDDDRRQTAAAGDGASSAGRQGNEVDPGVG